MQFFNNIKFSERLFAHRYSNVHLRSNFADKPKGGSKQCVDSSFEISLRGTLVQNP